MAWLGIVIMKNNFVWILVPVLVLGTTSCKKKDDVGQASAPEVPAEVTIDPKDSQNTDPVAVPTKALSAEKRAELVGFAGHLPNNIEYLISVHDGKEASRRVMTSKIWKTFAEMSGMPIAAQEAGAEVVDEAASEVPAGGPAMMFGEEFTIAMGKGTSEQLGNLVQANARLSYYQMSGLVKMLSDQIANQDKDGQTPRLGRMDEQFMIDLLKDEKSGVGLFEETDMPPMYVAFKTSDENREMINQQVASGLQFLTFFGDIVKPASAERGNHTFKGYQIAGDALSEQLKEGKAEIEEIMTSATADRLIAAVAKKNLFLVSGIHGDYVVLFIGDSLEDLTFAQDAASSLAGGSALTFCDDYADKDLLAVCYGRGKGLKSVINKAKGNFADISAGIRDGLAGSDQFGDTRNIDALLRMVEEKEAAVQALASVNGGGTIAFFEDGLKIESFGGYDSGYNNWQAENQLASLGTGENVMFFANVTSNVDYDGKMRDYIETLFETAYACAMKVTELPIEDNDMVQFKNYMQLFDTKFRVDLLSFWNAFSNGFDGSLGQERALVVDLQGAMPAFPGVAQEVVDRAKFPRVTWIAPVVDRSKLAGSWGKMNDSLTNIAATLSEMAGKKIPMQKPLSSDKDGSKTWFFPLPFFNDDFLPSVTVNDNWFAASSSKLQAVDLIDQAQSGGKTSQGFVMKADFADLHDYAKEMTILMGKNAEAIGMSENDLKQANKIIDSLSEIDSLDVHVRRESGLLRSSFHFKVVGE